MKISNPAANTVCSELVLMGERLPLAGARLLELGCGRARMTRAIVEKYLIEHVLALEVDEAQLSKNLLITDLPKVEFKFGGAEQIDAEDNQFDVVLLFKSLHHVPKALMGRAMREVARVLKPDGFAWVSEPVYAGAFNEILRLFHDEKIVRELAFNAVRQVVDDGVLQLEDQIFCSTLSEFRDFSEFEERILNVTHTDHRLDDGLYQKVKFQFEQHLTESGARFENPIRIDLLKKP